MTALLVYPSGSKKFSRIIQGILRGLQEGDCEGHTMALTETGIESEGNGNSGAGGKGDPRESVRRRLPVAPHTLPSHEAILVGIETMGWWGKKIHPLMEQFIAQGPPLDGKRLSPFVYVRHPFQRKTCHELMRLLESRGAFLFDFEVLRSLREARSFGVRIGRTPKEVFQ